ncbi:MAG: Maf family nucleotide pyrophosphatase [Patescibacteria group bacterium]
MEIILGSASRLRLKTMESLGIPFRVVPSHFDEEQTKKEDIEELVVATAKGKADVLAPMYPDAIIITVDSNNFFDGKIYGKPTSCEQAKEWLMSMAGKSQEFYTALVLTHFATGKQTIDVNISRFFFKSFSEEILDAYLAQVDPTTMAIGWAPAGLGLTLLERFEGEPGADTALPLVTLKKRLREFGAEV